MSRQWKRSLAVLASVWILVGAVLVGCGQNGSGDQGRTEEPQTEEFQTEESGNPRETGETDPSSVSPKGRFCARGKRADPGKNHRGTETVFKQPSEKEEKDQPPRKDPQETPGQKDSGDTDQPPRNAAELSRLTVKGTHLVNEQGEEVQLRGISTHGLAWYPGYVNKECFAQLKEEWGINVIRLAMYTAESGGYCAGGDRESLKTLVQKGVEYAAECGMYAIIDWHILSDGNPNTHIEDAKDFFREMSETYADAVNVIYEICNEPNGSTTWQDVKTYAEQIIDVIRENDKDGVILVGTPNWCQYVDQAAADPLTDCSNVMYTLHFYAATHKESLRNAMVNAIESGLPVFVSEYGICDASGNGAIDREQADQWVSVMDQYGVSYVAWNLSNKGETSALLKSGCDHLSGFTAQDLSDSGKWLYETLTGREPNRETGQAGGSDREEPDARQKTEPEKSPEPEQASLGRVLTSQDGIEVTAEIVNSWEQDGQSCFQYLLTLRNATDTACTGWTVELEFSSDIALDGSWNGVFETQGNRIRISSADYNGVIPSGGSVGDVGFIVRGANGLTLSLGQSVP